MQTFGCEMSVLKKRSCLKCGKEIDRYKYCEQCALIRHKEMIAEGHELEKQMRKDQKEEKKYLEHFIRNFTWDSPNDPYLG